ncbi:MAG: bifunctional nicotinamidase/pyrazinamidase [Devosia sp.]
MTISLTARDALIVVDIQYDFLPGGSLAVTGGDEIIEPVNAMAKRFANVVLTQDWHPADHLSFASNHDGAKPYETIELPYGVQILWPDHCIIGTKGAEFSVRLDIPHSQLVIRKGFRPTVDSYSAFQEADRRTKTGLAGYLRERNLERLFIAGLATDFCVAWSALDAVAAGFETYVIDDATRAIDTNGSLAAAWADMDAAGVKRGRISDVL